MAMDLSQLNQQVQSHVASPQLVAANHILALVRRSAGIDPARSGRESGDGGGESPICQQCGRPLQNGFCANCSAGVKQDVREALAEAGDFADDGLWSRRTTGAGDDEEFDPTARVAAQLSLSEHLTLSLQAQFPIEDSALIEYLVGNLDDEAACAARLTRRRRSSTWTPSI